MTPLRSNGVDNRAFPDLTRGPGSLANVCLLATNRVVCS
jgi:hypothetical protein